ncbi:MAG: AAA family ATPase [Propionibacteriaceae bacterium]|nr:AAA family ATPase [Propionibacteriaceae bacterium]
MTEPDKTPERAMEEFTQEAPALLSRVLGQLRQQSQRLRDLGLPAADLPPEVDHFNLSDLDPHAPGAFGALNPASAPTAAGAAPPAAPLTGADPAPTGLAAQPPAAEPTPEPEPEPEPKTLEELLAELDQLIGLDTVKQEIHRQSAILRVQGLRAKAGLKDPTVTRHLVFVGNPGTGKTTVARLVGGIYRALGLLSQGQLIEVDRSELVAGYLGQTAIKTAEVAAQALGGVLFIDEAYALAGDQYGEEAINTLVKEMEDHRSDLVVIVAGYPAPMERFIAENPGLASRFRTTIMFADYSDDELAGIFASMANQADYDLTAEATAAFRLVLAQQVRDDSFGNGRFARNVFEAAIGRQAWRLRDETEPSTEQLRQLLPSDIIGPIDQAPVDWPPTDSAEGASEPAQPPPEGVEPRSAPETAEAGHA